MEKQEFIDLIDKYSNNLGIMLHVEQKEKFYKYMQLLIEWNNKINLTAITEPEEIILKHFTDSISINKYISTNSYMADVGTGAGFPGIPLAIIRDDIKIVLVDSLNKRINFLNEVIKELGLSNVETIHSRAEELGQNIKYREQFDYVTSRAVANLATLSEYLIPLVKVDGKCICMKGPSAQEEIEKSKKAIHVLCGTIKKIDVFKLPLSDIERTVVVIEKTNKTNKKYPRKAGVPSKEPLQ